MKNKNVIKKNSTNSNSANVNVVAIKPSSTASNNKIIEDLNKIKNITLNEEYTKNFINFDIKLVDKNQIHTKKNIKINSENKSDISFSIKKIESIVNDTQNKVDLLKNEFEKIISSSVDKEMSLEINLLKSELINVKLKNEFFKLQSKFYENIFYTCKNSIENYNFQSQQNHQEILKEKLNSIFSQNNKYYYEHFNSNIGKENNNNKINPIFKIENEIQILMNNLNKNISNFNLENIFSIKSQIIKTQKTILSYYILNEDFNYDFKNKNDFYLENEDKFIQYESKQRTQKIVKDFSDFLEPNLNRVMTTKLKKEILDKIMSINTFYENFNIILKNENFNLKSNSNLFIQNSMNKVNNLDKLLHSYINFNENNFIKLKEMLEILNSKSIKNLDKILFSFIKNEEKVFSDLIDKFDYLYNNYFLIK